MKRKPGGSAQRRPYSLDSSLVSRIEEWAREHGSGPSPEDLRRPRLHDVDSIVTWLRAKRNLDYARKPEAALRKAVQRVIEQLDERERAASDADAAPKRARAASDGASAAASSSGDEAAEEVDDGAASGRRLMENPSHNLLNRGLLATYRAQQQPADAVSDRTAAAPAAAAPPGPTPRARGKERRRGGGGEEGEGGVEPSHRRARAGAARARTAPTTPHVSYADVGGCDAVLQDVRELIEYPLTHPEIYAHLGIEPPRGILLHGPPGCGKTLLANAIAGELRVPFLKISAPEIVSGMSGESEQKVRDLFRDARAAAPCLLFIDEIDAIAPKRETAQREMERRIVAQLLTCMDELSLQHAFSRAPERAATAGAEGGGGAAAPGAAEAAAAAAAAPASAGAPGAAEGEPEAAPAPVLVIAATNRPDALDPALRRAGRFDREICMLMPGAAARAQILRVLCRGMRVAGGCDFGRVAEACAGFVGADLSALAKEAAVIAVNRVFCSLLGGADEGGGGGGGSGGGGVAAGGGGGGGGGGVAGGGAGGGGGGADEQLLARMRASSRLAALPRPLPAAQLAPLSVLESDFWSGLQKVQPSARREGFSNVPGVSWADVGALQELRAELRACLLEPLRSPERFAALGLSASAGVLLYGPPGCGKTLLAKAVANESGACFIAVKGPELLSKWVGDSERAVRQVFARAASSPPCLVFFDELDALCPRRGADGGGGGGASERVVNQLLTEMDGLDTRRQVAVIGATNRPDMIDAAMLRPGRLDKCLYVPLPPPAARAEILRTACRRLTLGADVDLSALATHERCNGFSGADLSALAKEAAMAALREEGPEPAGAPAGAPAAEGPVVSAAHFELAFSKVTPSVSKKDEQRYLALRARMHASRVRVREPEDADAKPPPRGEPAGGGARDDDPHGGAQPA